MDPKNVKSAIQEIFKTSLEESKKKSFKDFQDKNSEDDEEENSEDEDEEEKKSKSSKKKSKKDDEKKTVKEDIVDEETLAASSLHPAARSISDPKALSSSKVGMMSNVMGMMGNLDKGSMLDFYNKTMAQFGPGKDYGIGDKSDANKATLNMKPSNAVGSGGADVKSPMPKLNNPKVRNGVLGVKEDVEEMFSGEELSEEFKEKATTLFEAAINARLSIEVARLEEETAITLAETLNSYEEETTSKINTYLDYVAESWLKDNEVAIESTIRNELSEEFMNGLKQLFADHYINVPEDKIDLLSTMAEKINVLETELDQSISENKELNDILLEGKKKEVFENLSTGLTLTQQEKFETLAEGIDFNGDLETYNKKLMIIKETYFKTENTTYNSNINEETFEGDIEGEKKNIMDPTISRYVDVISRSVKK